MFNQKRMLQKFTVAMALLLTSHISTAYELSKAKISELSSPDGDNNIWARVSATCDYAAPSPYLIIADSVNIEVDSNK